MIDDMDYKLILELQKNSRQKYVDIAGKLGMSEAGVRKRIQRLTERAVIELTAVPDLVKLGYHNSAFIGLQVEMGRIDAVAAELIRHPDVHFVGVVTGHYDIIIWVARMSAGHLAQFIKEDLADIKGIKGSETLIILEIKKRTLGRLSARDAERPIANKSDGVLVEHPASELEI